MKLSSVEFGLFILFEGRRELRVIFFIREGLLYLCHTSRAASNEKLEEIACDKPAANVGPARDLMYLSPNYSCLPVLRARQ